MKKYKKINTHNTSIILNTRDNYVIFFFASKGKVTHK